jgi:hypothetical protein
VGAVVVSKILGIAIGVVFLLAVVEGVGRSHGMDTPANPRAITALAGASADQVTPASWADALLVSLGDPSTEENMHAVEAWETQEGGHWKNAALFNPLNTTQVEPGSRAIPGSAAGIQAYQNWDQGLAATVTTLRGRGYEKVRAELGTGTSAAGVRDAVVSSPWGTKWFAV